MEKDFLMSLPRSAQEEYLIAQEIIKGDFGKPGEPFMTTRALAEKRMVSIVTAQNIMVMLREKKLIELRGKKYYLSYEKQAQEMKERRNIIGILVPNVQNEFYASIAKSIKEQAAKKGFRVIIMDTAYEREQEKAAIGFMTNIPVMGLICVPNKSSAGKEIYLDCPVPCVMIGNALEGIKRSSVQVNSFPVAQRIARHLVGQGYKKFFYLGSDVNLLVNDNRYLGFRSGLEREGFSLPAESTFLMPQGSQDFAAAEGFLRHMLAEQTEPLGVFCYHDLMAAELCRVCHQMGRLVPDDVGIIGFDDLQVSKNMFPSISTVGYRISSMTEIALQLLFQEWETGKRIYDNYYVEPNFVARESTMLAEKLNKQKGPENISPD